MRVRISSSDTALLVLLFLSACARSPGPMPLPTPPLPHLSFEGVVRSILHDSKGNYWFGSWNEGAARWDGDRFTYFTTSDGLTDNQVRRIVEGRDGTIWFENGRGVSRFRYGHLSPHLDRDYGERDSWHLAPDDLWKLNPKLVITRVTGFGQTGPYAQRAGFATLAEAMSGFAAINGEADGGPLLPPIALTDEVTALAAAFATMVAVHHVANGGDGQIVDVSLLESMSQLMGPLAAAHRSEGFEQGRMGSNLPYSVPRGTYRTSDGQWIAVSASADSVAVRVMELLGLDSDDRFGSFDGRVDHREIIESRMIDFVAARTADEVLAAFEAANAAAAPILSVPELMADAHAVDREIYVELDGHTMQGPAAKLSATPAELRHAGQDLPDHRGSIDWRR